MFNLFGSTKKENDAPVYVITEGVESHWNYHISKSDKVSKSLCGRNTMSTEIPLTAWDSTPENSHIPESWCGKCYRKYLKDRDNG